MIGLLATPLKMKMGPDMNGYVNNAEVFVPIPTFDFPGVKEMLAKYREQAKERASIRSVITSPPTAMRRVRCSLKPSKQRRASTIPSSPTTCVRTSLTPSWAR